MRRRRRAPWRTALPPPRAAGPHHLRLRARARRSSPPLLASTTCGLTRENLINQREAGATRQATRNASSLSALLEASPTDEDIRQALRDLPNPSNARPIVERRNEDGTWRDVPLQPTVGGEVIPDELRASVEDGVAARMRIEIDGEPELVIGIPSDDGLSAYYEVVSLQDLEDTLSLAGRVAVRRVDRHHHRRRRARATGSAAAPCARWPTSAWPPRPSPAAASTPGWRAPTTRTSTCW